MTIVVIILLISVIAFAITLIKSGNKSKAEQQASKDRMYRKAYKFLSQNFITQKSVRHIRSQLANLSVFKREELYQLTTQYFLISWGASVAVILVTMFMYRDAISILMCIAFACMLNTTLVEKQLDNQYLKVLEATKVALSTIREEYMKTNSVVEAVNDADIPDILKRPFDEFYTILTSTDSEVRLQEFYEATPFRVLQTLVGISYNINNQGDSIDVYGNSNYLQALTVLTSDVNAEITKIVTQKQKFGKIEYLTFLPIFASSTIESYFTSIMPGTAIIYGGPIGYICRTLTLLSCIFCYKTISGINRTIPVKENDQSAWVLKFLANKQWRHFIDNLKVKNKKAYFLRMRLKNALSKKSIEHIYTEKVVYFFIVFIFALITTASVLSLGGEFVRNNTQQLSLVASDDMDAYTKDSIQMLDKQYFEKRDALQPDRTLEYELNEIAEKIRGLFIKSKEPKKEKFPDLSEDETKTLIKSYMPGLSDLQIIDQQKRLNDKYVTVKNVTFHWWLIWMCFGFACIGWSAPNISLKLRRIMVRTETEDDFMQLQTLVSMLMTTNMDTLDVLHELSQHSRIHKDMLTYCYHGYPSNPELELTRLQSKTALPEFKRFIGKLKLTVNDLSMVEAFSDLNIEREQIMRIREITIQATIDKKRGLCGPLSLTPMGFMVVGELLIPLGYLGIQEFMNALSSMG